MTTEPEISPEATEPRVRSRVREMAHAARPAERRISQESMEIAELRSKLNDMETSLMDMKEMLRLAMVAHQETFDGLRSAVNELTRRTVSNEHAISSGTIGTLARAQVARIMRDEGLAKE